SKIPIIRRPITLPPPFILCSLFLTQNHTIFQTLFSNFSMKFDFNSPKSSFNLSGWLNLATFTSFVIFYSSKKNRFYLFPCQNNEELIISLMFLLLFLINK